MTIHAERVNRPDETAEEEAVKNAGLHFFERQPVVPFRSVLTRAMWEGIGTSSVEGIREQLERQDFMAREIDHRLWVTTKGVIREESQLVGLAKAGRGQFEPLCEGWTIVYWLTEAVRRPYGIISVSRETKRYDYRVLLLVAKKKSAG